MPPTTPLSHFDIIFYFFIFHICWYSQPPEKAIALPIERPHHFTDAIYIAPNNLSCTIISPTIGAANNRAPEQFVFRQMGGGGRDRKLRLLCLHGFRTSGEIIKTQVTGKWPESVLQKLDLVFVDAPFPCHGKSDVEGIFDPPYYEWFQFNKEFTEYENFDECLAYIEECMIKNGPFDGLLGFSQGAILSAALPGLQAKGVALTKVPKIKMLVIIGGAKFRDPSIIKKAFSSPIQCPSVHFLGDQDFLKQYGTELLESFVDPLVIRHPKGHTIPRFDEKTLESMLSFLERMQEEVQDDQEQEIEMSIA